ncbi:MAG: hypothetical protein KDM91_03915 [Verrucomicrobiae bacterium]|nr:hypothetical protein [Verrucomicrobiae bacterium]MCP5538988.1 hypothetical protein [Akkermansiaceae bacterium]MCP5550625.1 hypothetical protein [Akkermansiaceae bacterium]
MKRRIRKTAGALAMLIVFGLVRTGWEAGLDRRLTETGLLTPPPTLKLADQIGYQAFFAVLGGLRPLVAFYTTLHAYDAWEYREWDTVERDYNIVNQLTPEDEDAWIIAAWHLHTNAAASFYINDALPQTMRETVLARDWVLKGAAKLEEGIRALPDSWKLHNELARVYGDKDKLADPCRAAEQYRLAMGCEGALEFVRRFYGYQLARCPGKEQEAYDYLKGLYDEAERHHSPSLIITVKDLETKLGIPPGQRIPDPYPPR